MDLHRTKEDPTWFYFLPGYMQGLIKVVISYPFDVVKIYMQTYKDQSKRLTTLQFFRQYAKFDPLILYRGAIVPIIIVPFERAITLYYAERINQYGSSNGKNHSYQRFTPFLGGLMIGFVSSLYYVPMQYITTNAALTKCDNYKNIVHFYKTKIQKDCLFRGFVSESIRSSLASCLFFGTFMYLRDLPVSKGYPQSSLLYAPFSSILSWIVIFPLDTLRTEKQTNGQKSQRFFSVAGPEAQQKSYSELIKNRFHTLGFIGFYRGLFPIIIRTIPSTTLGMYVYEKLRTRV